MRALIVEQGKSRGCLAAVRCLAQDGWTVGVGSPQRDGLASWSRYVGSWHHVPPAHHDLESFELAVSRAIDRHGYEVVFGGGEAEVLALSRVRDRLDAVVAHPREEIVASAVDKVRLSEVARAAGLTVPDEISLDDLADLREPVVLKARMHARPDIPGAPPRIDTNVVDGGQAALQRVAELEADGADVLAQRFHEGSLLAYCCVVDPEGEVLVESQQLSRHIWPLRAGASCRARTVQVDEALASKIQELLRSLGWHGLAEVQFIVPDDGPPRLIDLNGRFYGSMSLAIAAGARLPTVWAGMLVGQPVARSRARAFVRYQWLEGDLRRARRAGAAQVPGCLAYSVGARHSIMDVRDPAPLLRHLIALAR